MVGIALGGTHLIDKVQEITEHGERGRGRNSRRAWFSRNWPRLVRFILLLVFYSKLTSVSSPYTSPICRIYFKFQQPFLVHHAFVRKSTVLDSICTTSKEIHTEKLPDDAGHILIHFLYTGTYPALQDGEASTQFTTSVYVYAAARLLRLPTLANLSKKKMSYCAGVLTPERVVTLAADVGGLVEKDDSWFLAFVQAYLRQLLQDPALNKPTLLESFHRTATYSNILIEGMIQICRESMVPVQSTASQPSSSASSEAIATPPGSSRGSTCGMEPQPIWPSALEPEPKSETEEIPSSQSRAGEASQQKRGDEKGQALAISDYKKAEECIKEEKFLEAIGLLERVLSIQKETLNEMNPSRRRTEKDLARAYRKNNRILESIALLEHLVAVDVELLKETDRDRLLAEQDLGRSYLLDDRMISGITHLEHVVAVTKNLMEEKDDVCTFCEGILREAYEKIGGRLRA